VVLAGLDILPVGMSGKFTDVDVHLRGMRLKTCLAMATFFDPDKY
jgi:hypothetical protein